MVLVSEQRAAAASSSSGWCWEGCRGSLVSGRGQRVCLTWTSIQLDNAGRTRDRKTGRNWEVWHAWSLLFKMGKERGGETEKNVPRSIGETAWNGLNVVVHGGQTLAEWENANMATLGVGPCRSLVLGTFSPERQLRNGERSSDHLLPHPTGLISCLLV